ncbi:MULTISPECIES: acyl-CoA dehydrogenase family protein [unclassified Variovorax]|uniref:acyl-CoA dehydrogenase family protein n=1 Tax=unclassified Variovorax TaxID=663243 RepID=UPI00076BEB46|nr:MULTISPECIES: acyl-CoA dehydrogenase family protein [unclassified Variovorax]KWT87795.1 acyl-CoA dehydrogenase-like protein [Variovorax sp. WDL1]PNG59447.1 Cyclohex-1-ene-1-carbonyl-CoA dehydrogenase [Variovorax sp. B4]PNG60762.1 Cyclohex-1-ene-1-carbonyl-CoA dehydrogenase [Variovorax sp. B2]VTV13323.1 Acyl-CoA dehydrogenase [Variovorax sp. WDL1]
MDYLSRLEPIVAEKLEALAPVTDKEARFPRPAVDALAQAGLLGLISSKEVGGMGLGMAEASRVIKRLAATCPSTAMVVAMHYCAVAVLEQLGPEPVRRKIAAGMHLTTLALSEVESRSHFWAPASTATQEGSDVVLDARKSWITSAFEADSYVWSSKPTATEGASSIWLVDAKARGLTQPAPFDGLGMRGNGSSPVTAEGVRIPAAHRLGEDGKGFDVMMGTVLPWFSVLNASASVGIMEGSIERACGHATRTRHQDLGTSLADLPTIRAYLARGRIKTDLADCLLQDGIAAIGARRADTMLRVLEVKTAAAESALEVTDIAMRVCGGAAFRKEVGVERLFRDARAAHVMGPTSDVVYDFIGKAITGQPLF